MSKTSTNVKRKYNEKVYRQLNVQIPTDLYDDFQNRCAEMGIPQRQVIIELIEAFLMGTTQGTT